MPGLLALLHGFVPFVAFAQHCSDHTGSTDCDNDSFCTWDSTNSMCGCSISYNVDLMFVFDGGSAYQSSSDFDEVKDFIRSTVIHGAPASGFRLSLFPFTDGSAIEYEFSNSNDRTANLAAIDALSQDASTVADSRDGYRYGIEHFDAVSDNSRRKVMVLMSAGDSSSGNLCTYNSRDSNIYTFSITQGTDLDVEWQTGDYDLSVLQGVDCTVSDRSKGETLIKLDSFADLNSDDTYLNRLEDQLCPRTEIIRITEVQTSFSAGVTVPYVEMFNHGPPIDLDQTAITLTALSGTFQAQSDSTWGTNEYLVVYKGETNNEYPRCEYCNCSLSATTSAFCDSATYIRCGSSTQPSDAVDGNCAWNLADDADEWTVTVTIGGTQIDSVERSAADAIFPPILTGFSAALRKIGYDNQYSSSWSMSCNQTGTPGDRYFALDESECSIATCQNAPGSCGSANAGTCTAGPSCDCNLGYWENGLTCSEAPPVQSCVGLRETTSQGRYRVSGLADWDEFHRYKSRPCTGGSVGDCTSYGSGSASSWGIYTVSGERNDLEPAGFALSNVNNFELSNYTTCSLDTLAPSMAPTMSPTCALPPLEPCTAEIQQPDNSTGTVTYSYRVDWDSVGDVAFSCENPTRWEVHRNGNVDNDAIGSSRTSVTIADTQAFVTDTITLYAVWSSEDRNSSVDCDVVSLAPTKNPTAFPSQNPTANPTKYPTGYPTQAPTYNMNATIPYCLVEFQPNQGSVARIYWDEPYINPPDTPEINEIEYFLQWFEGAKSERISAESANPQTRTLDFNFTDTAFSMRVEWENPPTIFNFTECEYTTFAPTTTPTKNPTTDPTANPTGVPSTPPTRYPTGSPTMSPTYRPPLLDSCRILFRQDLASVDITWPGMDLSDSVNYPEQDDVEYEVIWDIDSDAAFTMDAFLHEDQLCVGNTVEGSNCTKFAREPFTATFDFSTDSACMEARYISEDQQSSCVNCTIVTSSPTQFPTISPTPNPTLAPTFGPVRVYFVTGMCQVDEWEGISQDSMNGDTSRRRRMIDQGRRLLQDDSDEPSSTLGELEMSTTDEGLSEGGKPFERCNCEGWECDEYYIPLEEISEKPRGGSLSPVEISRDANPYIYNITVDWEISFVSESVAQMYGLWNTLGVYNAINGRSGNNTLRVFVNDSLTRFEGYDENDPDPANPGQYREDIGIWEGTILLEPDNRFNDILLSIYQENIVLVRDQTDQPGEVFLLSLTNCTILPTNDTDAQPNDSRNCRIGYPGKLFLVIEDTDNPSSTTPKKRKNRSWQGWFWYVLLAVCVVLGILGFMAYKWWTNAKMKDSATAAVTEEYDDIIKEEDEGFGHDLAAENITNNPLADPVSHIRKTGPGLMDDEGDGGHTEIADRAQVTVEKFHVTETYGQTQATMERGE